MNKVAVPFPFRMDPVIREAAEKLAKLEDRSLNRMLNHLLRVTVVAELAKREVTLEEE